MTDSKGDNVMKFALVCSAAMLVIACSTTISSAAPGGLHIKRAKAISFNSGYYILTDGGGYRWDFQYYGNVYSGTNYAYSGGMYCQINGSNFQAPGNTGWTNKAGDEIEMGPLSRNGLTVHRRVKVYKDMPMARWLEIFENPTSAPITVQIAMYTCTNYTIQQTVTSSGSAAFGEKDIGFRVRTQGNNSPPTMHIVTSKRAKIRPTVSIQSNQIYVRYSLTVPAKKTVILCHFESQNRDAAAHDKMMKKFPTYKLLKDLPGSVRGMIVNMSAGGGIGGVDLDRSEMSDGIILKNGDPIFGVIKNPSFKINTLLGELDLPSDRIVGMAGGRGKTVRFVLLDGQVVSGQLLDPMVRLDLDGGGLLQIPVAKIAQWSYRVTGSKPNEEKFGGAYIVLRTGDRLRFDPKALEIKLLTRHGLVALEAEQLYELTMDNPGNAVHRAVFLNGSRLGGLLEPETLKLNLSLGKTVTVSRDMVAQMRFAEEEKPDSTLTRVVLTNGDELFGGLTAGKFKLATDFGQIEIDPSRVQTMKFRPEDLGRTIVKLWKGSILKGRLGKSQLGFAITPKTVLNVYAGQFVSIECPLPLPPQAARTEVEKLVAQLGSESYENRQKASKTLIKMGKSIVPILKDHLQTGDPEVRQRIEDVMEQLGSQGVQPTQPIIHPHMMRFGCKG